MYRSHTLLLVLSVLLTALAVAACAEGGEPEAQLPPRAVAMSADAQAGESHSPEPRAVATDAVSESNTRPAPVASASETAAVSEAAPLPTNAQAAERTRGRTPADTTAATAVEGSGAAAAPGAASASLSPVVTLPTTEVVKILAPSVVHIATELVGAGAFNVPVTPSGGGTGIVLSEDGHVLTNSHVVEGAQTITVTLHDGSSLDASVVGRDPTTDLAVIRIEADGLEPALLGQSSELQVGEDVIAIGHVMGLSGAPSVSKGVVSALERSIDTARSSTIVDLIQTDASINPGNSGGPLVNSAAEVIGINTAIVRGGQGIGFAVNIDDAKIVAKQLIDNGFVRRGYLGVLPSSLTPILSSRLGIDTDSKGVLLHRVIPGTPAERAGLEQWDIILAMDGQRFQNNGEMSKFLISRQPGDTVEVDVLRDGEEIRLELVLGTRPDN